MTLGRFGLIVVAMSALSGALRAQERPPVRPEVRIDATSAAQLEGLKGAMARHLDRFAFREAPLPFDWK